MKTEETTIDNFRYTVTLMPAEEALEVMSDLLSVIGPAMMGDPNMFSNLSGANLIKLAKRFAKHSKAYDLENNPDKPIALGKDWSTHFSGRYDVMFKWVLFCIEVNNFKGFLDGLTSAAKDLDSLEADPASASPNQSNSNG